MTAPEKRAQLTIHRIYLRDVVFEKFDSFKADEAAKPHVDVRISTDNRKLDGKRYEVSVRVLITTKQKEKPTFSLEVRHAGIFTIDGMEKEQMHAVINAQCPNILFPFVREVVSDLVTKGGFPQLLLGPMNFEALYRQEVAVLREKQATTLTH